MDKTYNPSRIENHWYRIWEERGYFKPSGEGDPYCIMIPPPNVTGTLHMGHAFQDTIMDTLVRFERMRGRNTLWQPGTDHAGIATQMVVERHLNGEGLTRHDLGREAFVERVWQWRAESGGTIQNQLRRMGASVDWSRERFTMDDGLSNAVAETFVRLFDEGLIYRGQRLVNWDPVLQTAVSDLEVESEEEAGHIWHMRYPLADADAYLTVATTRPETMLGDSAVAVHPEDERYQHLVGREVTLPLAERNIPIVADDYVDPEFGSGCVKITPAHDFNDYQVGQRNDLAIINVLTDDASMNDQVPAAYAGLGRFEARQRIIDDLRERELLAEVEDHKLMVPRGDRSGTIIEPYLTNQWFVDLTREEQVDGRPGGWSAITRPAIQAVKDGRIRFIPDNWEKTYDNWLTQIQDWCISRQIWWGHRIPAWYDADGTVYVGRSEDEVRSRYDLDGIALTRDGDVLDTWFSSALWPFSTLGWPDNTLELQSFYPTNTLVTGFDIIFFWVTRMIMFGLKLMGDVPFRDIYIHGLVRDQENQKMSKSKGNVLDPIDIIDGIDLESLVAKRTSDLMQPKLAPKIEKMTREHFPNGIAAHGTDALRFTFASLATTGRDVVFDMGRVAGYRNFCNKLWNAARYVLMSTEGEDTGLNDEPVELSMADRWIISRLQRTEEAVIRHFEQYRLDLASQAVYEFIWDEYCDWYLELSKPVLQHAEDPAALRGTRRTLVRVLEAVLRVIHPLMPFVSEDIWQRIAPLAGAGGETIMRRPYPMPDAERQDHEAEAEVAWLQAFILAVRRIRGEMNIAPNKAVPVVLANSSNADRERVERYRWFLDFLARLESLTILGAGDEAPESALALAGDMEVRVPMAGLIDKDAELARLAKERSRLAKEVERTQGKLANENFVNKAPEDVVQKERDKLTEQQDALQRLEDQYRRIEAL